MVAPLIYKPIPMKFGMTQDESAHPFALPSPLLQSLINGRAVKTGAIHKRPGWATIGSIGQSYSQLFSHNDGLLMVQPNTALNAAPRGLSVENRLGTVSPRADSLSGTANTRSTAEIDVLGRENVWRDTGYEGAVTIPGFAVGAYSSFPDHNLDTINNIEVIAWTGRRTIGGVGTFAVMAVAIDATTRKPVAPARVIQLPTTGDCQKPRVVAQSGALYVVYERPSANELRAVPFDTSTRLWGTDTVIASNLHDATGTGPVWDAYSDGGVWFCAYRSSTPNLTLIKVNGTTVLATVTIAEDPVCIGVYANVPQSNFWVGYYTTAAGLKVAVRNSAAIGSVVLAPTVVEVVTDTATQITFAPVAANQVAMVWTTRGFGTIATVNLGRAVTKYRTVTTAAALGTQCYRQSFELISRAWQATNGSIYANVLYDAAMDESFGSAEGRRSSGFQTAFTMCLVHNQGASTGADNYSFRPAATWAVGSAGRNRRSSCLSNVTAALVAVDGATEHRWCLATETLTDAGTFTVSGSSGVDLCRLNISVINEMKTFSAPIGRNVAFSGGVPQVFDGETLTEYGFLVPPENGRGVVTAAGLMTPGGPIAASLVEEYMLATGDVIRSAPAPVYDSGTGLTSMVVTAGQQIVIGFPALSLTNKYSDVSGMSDAMAATVKVYRTEANGSLFRFEGSVGNAYGAVPNLALQRGTNLSVTLTTPDANWQSHAILYTTDNILPNYPPPSLAHIVNSNNRLFGISAEDRRVIVFSHTYSPGELPGFHPTLQFVLPDEAVALATLDEKLVILCKHGIYVLTGDGPDRKGQNSNFNGPDLLNGPHGCVSPQSVVVFPLGIIFQAPTGLMMIDRGFGITRIGGPVEDTLAAYPVCLGSCPWPVKEWAYWSMRNAANTDYRTIVFDWRNNVWSVDQYTAGGDGTSGTIGLYSMAVLNDELYGTFAANSALYQHTGYDDPLGTWIVLYMRTAWIGVGQLQTFQRMRHLAILAQYHSGHDLSVLVNQNFGAITEGFFWTNAEISVLSYDHLRHHIANQRTTATQVILQDAKGTQVSPFGAGASFVGIVLDIGFKANVAKLPQNAMR